MIKNVCLAALLLVSLSLSISAQPVERMKDRLQGKAELGHGPIARAVAKEILTGIAFYPDEIIVAIFEVCQNIPSLNGEVQPTSKEWIAAHAYLSHYPSILVNLKNHPLSSAATGRIAKNNPEEAWKIIDEIRKDSGQTLARSSMPAASAAASANSASVPLFVPYPAPWAIAPTTIVQSSASVKATPGSPTTTAVPAAATVTTGTVTTSSGAQGRYATVATASGAGVATAVAGDQAAHVGASGVRQLPDGTVQTGSAGATVVTTPYGNAAVGHAGSSSVNTSEGQSSSAQAAGVVTSTGRGAAVARQGETQWDATSYQHSGRGTVQTAHNGGATYTRDASGAITETGTTHSTTTTVTANNGQTATLDRDVAVTQDASGAPSVDRNGSVSTESGQSYSWNNSASPASSSPNATAPKSAKSAATPPSTYMRQSPSSSSYSMSQMTPQGFDSAMRTATRQNSETFARQERSLQEGNRSQGARSTPDRPSPSAANKREGGRHHR
jgi:hypothetical protein